MNPRIQHEVRRGWHNTCMPVLNDEVPDGEFNDFLNNRFSHGGGDDDHHQSTPPSWLDDQELQWARGHIPMPYVHIVPIRVDDFGRVTSIATLLQANDDGVIERSLIAGRVLYCETIREAIARNIAKDLGSLALPLLPQSLQPFAVAEFFPTPALSEYCDLRQHAIALCYCVVIRGDCQTNKETLVVQWDDPHDPSFAHVLQQMDDGCRQIVQRALHWLR